MTEVRKFAVITGAPSGMGYELAKQLKLNGFDLLVASASNSIHAAAKDFEALGAQTRTASVAGTMPTPNEAVYGATKTFVRSLSQSLREELKDTGISVLPAPLVAQQHAKRARPRICGRRLSKVLSLFTH